MVVYVFHVHVAHHRTFNTPTPPPPDTTAFLQTDDEQQEQSPPPFDGQSPNHPCLLAMRYARHLETTGGTAGVIPRYACVCMRVRVYACRGV